MIIDKKVAYLNNYLKKCTVDGVFPGCVYALIDNNDVIIKEFGYAQLVDKKRPMTKDILFDLASLTKVVATTTAVMMLIERGEITLNTCVKDIFPDYKYDKINIRHLLTHTAGYPPEPKYDVSMNRDDIVNLLLNTESSSETFEKSVVYSDVGFMILGIIIDKITSSFKEFAENNIFKPLNMNSTCFEPNNSNPNKFASTELCPMRKHIITGVVHDEKSYLMGGTAGHAGLFSSAEDLSKFVIMLLNGGAYNSNIIINEKTIELMSKCYTEKLNETRGLGWITKGTYQAMGDLSSNQSIFHTGFTGTSILVDRKYKAGFILLTNRVHPSRENRKLVKLRCNINNIAMSSITNN